MATIYKEAKDIVDAAVAGAIAQVRKEPPNPAANLPEAPLPTMLPASAPKPVGPTKPSNQSYT